MSQLLSLQEPIEILIFYVLELKFFNTRGMRVKSDQRRKGSAWLALRKMWQGEEGVPALVVHLSFYNEQILRSKCSHTGGGTDELKMLSYNEDI